MISVTFLPSIQWQDKPKWRSLIRKAVQSALKFGYAGKSADVSVLLGDDSYLQALNRQYAGQDHPTDVLSFEVGTLNPEDDTIYLGDVAISVERAAQQAFEAHHPLEQEIQLLTVHGVLHLCGFDHATPEEQARMWQVQAQALSALGTEDETSRL